MRKRLSTIIISMVSCFIMIIPLRAVAAEVDWCNLQWPPAAEIHRGEVSDFIYGCVFEPGVTEGEGQGEGIGAETGFGPAGSLPGGNADWSWFSAVYNTDYGDSDEYMGVLDPDSRPEPAWETPALIATGDNVFEIDMAVSENTLYAAWEEGIEPRGIWFSKKTGGGSWEAPVNTVEYGSYPCIAAHGAYVDIVYTTWDGTWYTGSTDGGATWSEPAEVYSGMLRGKKLAADEEFVYLVYNDWYAPEISEVYFKKKMRGNQWFDWPVHLFTLDMYKAMVAAVDFEARGDDLHVLFQASGTYGVGANHYYGSTDRGATWDGFEFSDRFGVPPYMLSMTQMDVENADVFIAGGNSLFRRFGGDWLDPVPFWSKGASGLRVTPEGLHCVSDMDRSCSWRFGRESGADWGEVRGIGLGDMVRLERDLAEGPVLHLLVRDETDWLDPKWYSVTSAGEAGVYDYCCRFTQDGGLTWKYGDLDGNDTGGGGINGYSANQAGRLALLVDAVDRCNLQWPLSMTVRAGEQTPDVYGRVYEEGVTDEPGQGAGITAEVGYGADMSSPIDNPDWTWFPAVYNMDYEDDDEYNGTMIIPGAGLYDYCFRFSADGGDHWVYCSSLDNDTGNGGPECYSTYHAGELKVKASFHVLPFHLPDRAVPGAASSTAGRTDCFTIESDTVAVTAR